MKGSVHLPRREDDKPAGIELDVSFQLEQAGREGIHASDRGVVHDHRPPGHPAELPDQSGPFHAVREKAEAHDCVERGVRIRECS
jgi:hypothetical protein